MRALRGGDQLFHLSVPPSTAEKSRPSVPKLVVFSLAGSLTAGMNVKGPATEQVMTRGLMMAPHTQHAHADAHGMKASKDPAGALRTCTRLPPLSIALLSSSQQFTIIMALRS